MGKLPIGVIRKYTNMVLPIKSNLEKVFKQLPAHCFTYRCQNCF